MIRMVVLGTVTFLVSAGVAVGVSSFLAGEPGDLSAALAETLESDSIAADPAVHEPLSLADESGMTLMEEVDQLISRIEGVEVAMVGEDSTAAPDSTAKSIGTPASDSTALVAADSAATGSGEVQKEVAALAAEGAAASRPTQALAGAGTSPAQSSGAPTGANGVVVPGLLPEARLGRIFGSMQPRDAARVLEQMDNRDIATILTMLNDRQAAAVLSNLAPDRAAAISASGLGAGEGN